MIPVRNIYYMLSYAFKILQAQEYENIETEKFENVSELFAAILAKGISLQLKRGLNKDYVELGEPLSSPRGKIIISESVKIRACAKLFCAYNEFSENSYLNRILKTTLFLLLKSDIKNERKRELRKLIAYFSNVDMLDARNINWRVQYNRNNQTYHLLISICKLALHGLLNTETEGKSKLMNFSDEQGMCRLYEKFILEYYRKHFSEISANAEQIRWQLDDGNSSMLPIMQSDITLKKGNVVLIIDAKYYEHTTQERYNAHTLHSANLYQIFTYVKNKENELSNVPHKVSGMLLYAKTDEEITPNNSFKMTGNRIDVKTLDLNCEFCKIKKQLNAIVEDFFGAV